MDKSLALFLGFCIGIGVAVLVLSLYLGWVNWRSRNGS